MRRKPEYGNILFLILLAVILFAALSYAVTSSLRGGGNDATPERNKLMATNIMEYGSLLTNTITRLRLTGNCKDTDIDFSSPATHADYVHSPDTPDKCKVFHASGGNLPYKSASSLLRYDGPLIYDAFVGRSAFPGMGTSCADASCADLYWFFELPDAWGDERRAMFCDAYNLLAIGTAITAPPDSTHGTPYFNGTYTGSTPVFDAAFNNQITLCSTFTNRRFIYYVLLPR